MSLQDFKRTLQACSSLPNADFSGLSTIIIRKSNNDELHFLPRKSSLKEQIASIERLAANLDYTPTGESLPPAIQEVHPQKRSKLIDAVNRGSSSSKPQPQKRFSDLSHKPLAPKRTRLSDYADLIIRGEYNRGGCIESQPLQAEQNFVLEKPLSQAPEGEDVEEEDEEDDVPIVPGDSEAGLFIQSQIEGMHEPLVLWSPDGADEEIVQVPPSINSRLLEHQRDGVQFLYSLYRENKGGVLGDDMGLGKTIQVIAFLSAILKHNTGANKAPKTGPVLIICPTSVLRNWEQEFHAWGSFDVAIYHGSLRELVLRRLESFKLQIVLTSFDTFRIHGECLCASNWDCVIIDEAHRLKNSKSDLYKACLNVRTKRRYGLTGTIMQNKIIDLFNVFDWVAPGCLGTREHFKEFYEGPLKQGQRISAPERFIRMAEERKSHLVKLLQGYLLRREKQDTIGHLMMGKEDNVVFCEMSPLQHRAYKRLLGSPDFQRLIRKDEPCSCGSPLTRAECCYRTAHDGIIWPFLHRENSDGCDSCPYCLVLPCLTKLQQVSNHLELIKPNVKDDLEKQKKDEALAKLILAEDAALIGGPKQIESFLGLSDAQHCGKMRALEQLLHHWVSQGDKVLLFSFSVRMLDILEKFHIRKGYCFSRLDGSIPMGMRQSIVDDFNHSPSKQVFLISTRAGGFGLNLVSANRVVIFDPNWNPAQDLQAQDRSFRFGQRRHVTVYRLLAAGSLEELVYSRQIYKQQLFNIAVSGGFEKRYFDGVQDSKENKGELFGICNLFRDLSEKAFTSDIIEMYDRRVQIVKSNASMRRYGENGKMIAEEGKGTEVIACVDISYSKPCKKPSLGNEVSNVLKDAGIVYSHRYEDVVNCKPATLKSEDGVQKATQKSNHILLEKPSSYLNAACNMVKGNEQINSKKPVMLEKKNDISPRRDKKSTGKEMNRNSRNKAISKEEQFAYLATLKSMSKVEFSKWLLLASELEKQNLLCQLKQAMGRS